MKIRIQKLQQIYPFYFLNSFLKNKKIRRVDISNVAEIEIDDIRYDERTFSYLKDVIQSEGYDLDGKFLLSEYKDNKYVQPMGEIHFDLNEDWICCSSNSKRLCDIANKPLGRLLWLFKAE